MFLAVPGDLATPTGGYAYARRVLAALPVLTHLPLPGGFPFPARDALRSSADALAGVPPGDVLLIDGLAYGALPDWCLDRIAAPVVALVHHPLCLETGLADAARAALLASERAALARAGRVIATSATTALTLTALLGVPPERLGVAEPGTDPARRSACQGFPPRLLAVGAVVPRKGYPTLIEALAGLADVPWHLTIAGALDRDASEAARVRAAIAATGLADRVVLAGAVDAAVLDALYASADVFVTASLFEGYGMAAAEAMAHGLPLVAASGGALAATVPADAALACASGDADALRGALRRMLKDADVRAACAAASWSAGQGLPRWETTAARIYAALRAARRGREPSGR